MQPRVALPEVDGEAVPLHPAHRLFSVRELSLQLTASLCEEEYVIQSMPDVSPPKWHLAHTTWFFETFVLQPFLPGYEVYSSDFNFLFNSYYDSVGERQPRARRGMLARPAVGEVKKYRQHVDRALDGLICEHDPLPEEISRLIELGIHHEQQHQELLVTDIKQNFWSNPLLPAYHAPPEQREQPAERRPSLHWIEFSAGLSDIGSSGDGFCFDNELPRHPHWLQPYAIASRCVTNAEYLEFMKDGGYDSPLLWLSDGWQLCRSEGWRAPLYWLADGPGGWLRFGMDGVRPLHPDEPVCHVSYFEADAFARWSGNRLPTEAEWETAAAGCGSGGAFLETGRLHPSPIPDTPRGAETAGMLGNVWQWTGSQYLPYPGFRPAEGSVGEYNGKFMCNQFVLRGGSCATPASHIRPTYRNFFPPGARWQFSGLRLARDLS